MGLISNLYNTYKTKRDTMNTLTKDLPGEGIMGREAYAAAYKNVKSLYDQGKIQDARKYVKSQLLKIKAQNTNKMTGANIEERLRNYRAYKD